MKELDDRDLELESGQELTDEEESSLLGKKAEVIFRVPIADDIDDYELHIWYSTDAKGKRWTYIGGNDGGCCLDNYKFPGWVTARAVAEELKRSVLSSM